MMEIMISLQEIVGKQVIVRGDLDVPVKDGKIENDYRLQTLIPTLNLLLSNQNKVLLIGHMGRPEGIDPSLSLAPVQEWLKEKLNQDIPMFLSGFSPGEWWKGEHSLSMLDNLRFDNREETKDRGFATELTQDADYYVYDAFATYRPCTSLSVIPEVLPTTPGLQFQREIAILYSLTNHAEHPTLLLASGAKLDKLEILKKIATKFDKVLYGGKFADPSHLTPDGLDLNDEAITSFAKDISEAKTIVMNGPLGYYEDGIHSKATKAILEAIKSSQAMTVLGGGDTLAAIPALGFNYEDFGFVSTGGGAMLDYLATGSHPLLDILNIK